MYKKEKWSDEIILAVWKKGKIIGNNNSNVFRKDACGAWMKFSDHGDRDVKYGWEIDHINPVSNGGGDVLSNLQPLHWENNMSKGDSSELKCTKVD